jgi:hypothetical protein
MQRTLDQRVGDLEDRLFDLREILDARLVMLETELSDVKKYVLSLEQQVKELKERR